MSRELTDARMEALRKRYPAVEKVLGVFGILTGECGGVLFEDSEGFEGVEVYRKDLLQIAEFMRELAQIAPEMGSRAVMASIRPRHTADILSGRKTIEVRKNSPDLPTPFRVYIYETMDRGNGRGKVVGEFVCDEIREERTRTGVSEAFCEEACLTAQEILNYAGGGWLYGWHITGLIRYDEPREIDSFLARGECVAMKCHICRRYNKETGCALERTEDLGGVRLKPMRRPPQSWCYVEDVG